MSSRSAETWVQVASLLGSGVHEDARYLEARSWEDYVDPYVLVLNGIDIVTGLSAARAIDPGFDPVHPVFRNNCCR